MPLPSRQERGSGQVAVTQNVLHKEPRFSIRIHKNNTFLYNNLVFSRLYLPVHGKYISSKRECPRVERDLPHDGCFSLLAMRVRSEVIVNCFMWFRRSLAQDAKGRENQVAKAPLSVLFGLQLSTRFAIVQMNCIALCR